MTWNHRVVKTTYRKNGTIRWAIHENHMFEDGDGHSKDPVTVDTYNYMDNETDEVAISDLRWQLLRMLEALDKPIIVAKETV